MVKEFKKIDPNQIDNKQVEKKSLKSDKKGKNFWKKGKYFIIPFVVLLLVIAGLTIPAYIFARPTIKSAQKTMHLAQEAYDGLKNQDLPKAEEKLKETQSLLRETQENYKKLSYIKAIPMVKKYYQDGEAGLNAGIQGVEAGLILVEAVTPYADVLGFKGQGSFSGGTAEDRIQKIVQTLDKVTPKMSEVAEKLTKAQSELDKINAQDYPEEIRGKQVRGRIVQLKSVMDEAVAGVTEARPILSVLPNILGYPNSKKYLVIFQNDGELRATGGFMTAFSVLNIDSGKIKPEKSDDIYSLDRKFNSRIQAPEPIEKYLFSADLGTGIVPYFYLRDMNLSPDFKKSMDTFYEHYSELPGEYEVDGIIAVDTYVLEKMVEILGEINVPGYGKFTIEPDKRCHGIPQIICELEYIVDQPLPTQVGGRKANILGPMLREVMLKAMGSPKNMWPQLFSQGLALLEEKHALMYFKDEEVQKAVEAFGAGGRIKEAEQDYLHVNDSNFGGAKSNLFTEHEVVQEYEIDESGNIVKTVTLIYENNEKMDNCNLERESGLCLNSILRNYVRVYVPKGSELIEGVGSEVDIETKEALGKSYFDGFLTVRGEGGRAKMEIKYKLPFNVNPNDNLKLLVQKQPGTEGHDYKIVFGERIEEFELRTDRKFEFEY